MATKAGKLGGIFVVLSVFFGLLIATAQPADDDKQLGRLKGVVGFATTADAPLHQIVGRELIPDDDYAITGDLGLRRLP